MSPTPPKVLIFLADDGLDPTECSVPWSIFKAAGCSVFIATEHGVVAKADQKLLSRSLFASVLGATKAASEAYSQMKASPEHQTPLSWVDGGFDILSYGCPSHHHTYLHLLHIVSPRRSVHVLTRRDLVDRHRSSARRP